MVMEWIHLAKKLAPDYPSMNKGYPTARMRVYATIADRYGVHQRTVARCLSPVMKERAYGREYHRVLRRLDTILPALYNGNSELSLPELSERLQGHAGIRMQEGTLERLLGKHNGERAPPLLRTESGSYRLNPSYYSSQNVPAYQGNGVSPSDQTQPA
jgi:hypothetical protein